MPKGMKVSYLWVTGFHEITLVGFSVGLQCVFLAEQWVLVMSCLMIGLLPSIVAHTLRKVNSVYTSWWVAHQWHS